MEEYTDGFMVYLEQVKKAAENTIAAYRQDLKHFFSFLQKEDIVGPEEITPTLLQVYVFSLEQGGTSQAAAARRTAAVRAFLKYLSLEGILPAGLTEGMKPPLRKTSHTAVLTFREMEKLFAFREEKDTPAAVRDRAMIEVLYGAGLKTSELSGLCVSDISVNQGYLICREGRERLIPLGGPAASALSSYLETSRDKLRKGKTTETLFLNRSGEAFTRQGVWKLTARYGKAAGLDTPLTPVLLRNSFAAHMLFKGADAHTVSEIMGCSEASLSRFLKGNAQGRIRDVYKSCHPRA